MRALLPEPNHGTSDRGPNAGGYGAGGADEVDLHEWYGSHWLDRGGVRVNFIASADGAVSVAGVSAGLQTPGDNRAFAVMRDLSDVIVAGAGTVRREEYGPSTPSAARRALRARYGVTDVPPIAVISRSLSFSPDAALFTDAVARTIVLTCAAADPGRRKVLEGVANVVLCGDQDVDPALARTALEERGLTRIVCEGGPSVLSAWAAAGVVDELCLTISPLLAGPGSGRIVAGPTWVGPHRLVLTGLLEEDGALFCRYRSS